MKNFITLEAAENLANELIEKYRNNSIGFPLHGYTFKWNNRRQAYGVCSYIKKEIQLSKILTVVCTHDQVENTILHEIAHAIAGSDAGHGYRWQKIARQIGCDGSRCNNHIHHNNAADKTYRLIAECPNCGTKSYMNRKSKLRRSCKYCSNGRFNPNYEFIYKLNPNKI